MPSQHRPQQLVSPDATMVVKRGFDRIPSVLLHRPGPFVLSRWGSPLHTSRVILEMETGEVLSVLDHP